MGFFTSTSAMETQSREPHSETAGLVQVAFSTYQRLASATNEA